MSERRLDVLVVDDEAPARDELAFLLGQQEAVGRVAQAADSPSALELISRGGFDAVFLDIRMPNLDGLALARLLGQLARPPLVVFVTAYEDYAVEAFGLDAIDYLLKPVRPERLSVTIGRLLRQRGVASEPRFGDRVAAISGGRILLVPAERIRAAVAEDEGASVLTPEGRYRVRQSLGELEHRLGPQGFLRVHRAWLVNLKHVAAIETFFNGTYLLKLVGTGDLAVPVSRRHAAELRSALGL